MVHMTLLMEKKPCRCYPICTVSKLRISDWYGLSFKFHKAEWNPKVFFLYNIMLPLWLIKSYLVHVYTENSSGRGFCWHRIMLWAGSGLPVGFCPSLIQWFYSYIQHIYVITLSTCTTHSFILFAYCVTCFCNTDKLCLNFLYRCCV